MDLKFNNKQLVAVEYPGTVVNIDNMSKTLGGEKNMFNIFNHSTKRLELRFRPDDPYCKCAHGDKFNTTNLLLKVIRRTKKNKKADGESDEQLKVEILGAACTTYKFKALSDFQLLPVVFDNATNKHRSLLQTLVPTSLHTTAFLDQNVNLFIPPIMFSRFDLPQAAYADSFCKKQESSVPSNIIGRGRKRRMGHTLFLAFESNDPIPTEPKALAMEQIRNVALDMALKSLIDAAFLEHPIWSKNSLAAHLKCDRNRLKYVTPCSGYYFSNGPWRTMWIRFGFDPRKDPLAKTYQIVDLRITQNVPCIEPRTKRSQAYYTLPKKTTCSQNRVATIDTQTLLKKDETLEDDYEKFLNFRYIPGQLPPARQMFYQLCDVHLDSVQALVHKNDGKEDFCHEKDGWCEAGVLDKCRELILADIMKTAKELKTTEN